MIAGLEGRSIALLLAAHGEQREDTINAGAKRLADALSSRNVVSEVGLGFIKGTPPISEALRTFTAAEIIVYPLFASDGYFARDRLMQLLKEAEPSNHSIHVLPPLGVDPGLAGLITQQAAIYARTNGFSSDEAVIVLMAHGSRYNSASRLATERLAQSVKQCGLFRSVRIALLEESPSLHQATADVAGPILVIGLFCGNGMHGAGDVPRLIAELGRGDVVFGGNIVNFEGIEQLVVASVTRILKYSFGSNFKAQHKQWRKSG